MKMHNTVLLGITTLFLGQAYASPTYITFQAGCSLESVMLSKKGEPLAHGQLRTNKSGGWIKVESPSAGPHTIDVRVADSQVKQCRFRLQFAEEEGEGTRYRTSEKLLDIDVPTTSVLTDAQGNRVRTYGDETFLSHQIQINLN